MAIIGGALPSREELRKRMRELGMLQPTREERLAELRAAFERRQEHDDPEQQEWVISGEPEPE